MLALALPSFLLAQDVFAQTYAAMPWNCAEGYEWNTNSSTCTPGQHEELSLNVHANVFGVGIIQQGPRGRDGIAIPSQVLVDVGKSVANGHYLNLNLALTADKWTFPERGYPLLLQTGEYDANGRPYVDAQHPHSSPIMGLTFSDTIRLDEKQSQSLKLFFAPRGQSTDGPIFFMNRPTAFLNPDAPLGHHTAQDVGHITSTVIGATLRLEKTWVEASAFNGSMPEPTKVDLGIGTPNSIAVRVFRQFDESLGTFSMARVKHSAAHETTSSEHGGAAQTRLSASFQSRHGNSDPFEFHQAFIAGIAVGLAGGHKEFSFGEELRLDIDGSNLWARVEALQRQPQDLGLSTVQRRWIGGFTLGYSRTVGSIFGLDVNFGLSGMKYLVPPDFAADYGEDPWAGKAFVQLVGPSRPR